jgi:glucokinase
LAQPGVRSSLVKANSRVGGMTARDVFNEAATGDPLAEKIVEDTALCLAIGATNVLHTIDPDMVVFAGGMIAAGDSFLERIQDNVQKLAFPVPAEEAKICYAHLGSDAGFIGAAGCARSVYRDHKSGMTKKT